VLGEPMLIPGVGQYVSFMDSEGNRVSMLQPLRAFRGEVKKGRWADFLPTRLTSCAPTNRFLAALCAARVGTTTCHLPVTTPSHEHAIRIKRIVGERTAIVEAETLV